MDNNNDLEPGDRFIGFPMDDDQLEIFEYKKKCLLMEIKRVKGGHMEVDKPSNSSSVIEKERQSESNKFSTPTFNLTSSNARSGSGARGQNKVDINNAIYKLPFEHGWKRELVYRKSCDSTILNPTNFGGDVYYYSPNNLKLGSLQKIQEQLDISSDKTSLTIESFSFIKEPTGINDQSKELIRAANYKLSKEDSFFNVAVGPKRSKNNPPVKRLRFDYESSDDDNNMSSDNSESINKSSVSSPNPEIIDVNNTIITKRNSEMNGSLREITTPFISMQSLNYMVNSLLHIFKHLKLHELLLASRVCNSWHLIARNKFLWQNVSLRNSRVRDWEKFVDYINQQGTDTLDTRDMLIPSTLKESIRFWSCFSTAMKRAHKLKLIELHRCPTHVVEDIIYSLPQLEVLNASSIKIPILRKVNDLMDLNLNYLGQMKNLTELRLKGITGIKLTSLPSFENLIHLNKFSLTSVKSFPNDIGQSLDSITDKIEFLEIGDCNNLSEDFAVSLKRFVNLKSLRLENCCDGWVGYAQDVFTVIRGLEKLNVLELVNLEFSNCVKGELEKCNSIKALLIIPTYVAQAATTNCHLIDCLKKLSKTLTHLVWGLTNELLSATELFITQYQQNLHDIGYKLDLSNITEVTNNLPILRIRENDEFQLVDVLSISALEKLIDIMMPDTETRLIKVPISGTSRVYLSEQFKDI